MGQVLLPERRCCSVLLVSGPLDIEGAGDIALRRGAVPDLRRLEIRLESPLLPLPDE